MREVTESERVLERLVKEAREDESKQLIQNNLLNMAPQPSVSNYSLAKEKTNEPDVERVNLDAVQKNIDVIVKQIVKTNDSGSEERNLDISDTAKKHLGMSEEENIHSRKRIDSIFTTIGSSFEDSDSDNPDDALVYSTM